MNYRQYFSGQNIVLMGLGALGRGVGDARFLAECGAEVLVTDRKPAEELEVSVKELKKFPNITFRLGGHRKEDFKAADLVIKSAGVPYNSPYLKAARKNGVPIKMSTALFARFSPSMLVGITGTRGKSTVTHCLEHILRTAGRKIFVGGNVRGVSTLAHLPMSTADELSVLELDSWQLQGFGEESISPQLAVFTALMRDHMNYYKNDFDRYLADKANIFINQNPTEHLVLGEQCAKLVRQRYPDIVSQVAVVGEADLPADWRLLIPGRHNRYNVALARRAATVLGLSDEEIRPALESFAGVPGRLEYLGQKQGVHIYNDNNATTPDATLAALEALGEYRGRIVLIGGGADKELDFAEYAQAVPEYVKRLVLLAGEATDKIRQLLPGEVQPTVTDSLEQALDEAIGAAEPGEVMLFSPAAASFNMFRHEYERSDRFTELVDQLPGSD